MTTRLKLKKFWRYLLITPLKSPDTGCLKHTEVAILSLKQTESALYIG